MVVFRKDVFTEDYLKKLGLNERQVSAIDYVKKNGKITNKEYQELTKTSRQTASRDVEELVKKGIFDMIGKTGKGTYYIFIQTPHKRLINAS
jgi:ATP-dependent DNA helicase RecG